MHADFLITDLTQAVTVPGTGARRGPAMGQLEVIDDAAIAVVRDRIVWVGPRVDWDGTANAIVEGMGCVAVPALVDPHTHAVWGGDRLDDFDAVTRGATYQDILARGGGIRHTIAMTSAESVSSLADDGVRRIGRLIWSGAGTVEIKSGYGFTMEGEIASLKAIQLIGYQVDPTIVATLLIHVPPPQESDRVDYLAMVTKELIPEVARRQLAHAVDVFIERGAFTVDEARQIFVAAHSAGLPVKAHADQFTAGGGVQLAIEHRALSVDHLEASGTAEIEALSRSDTVAVMLPGVSLNLGIGNAPGRALVDAGATVAVGSDLNPGSSPMFSTHLAMALSVRLNGLTMAEAMTAATVNAAEAIGLHDVGRLAPGQRANLRLVDVTDWREIPWTLGEPTVLQMWIDGKDSTTC